MINFGFFQVFLTNQVCNGTCKYCALNKNAHREKHFVNLNSFKEKLKTHLIKLEKVLGTKDVVPVYWGGDPLFHPNFKEVVDIVEQVCKELDYNIIAQNGTTNGTGLTKDWIDWSVKHNVKWMLSNDLNNDRTQVPLDNDVIVYAFQKKVIDSINTVVTQKTYKNLISYDKYIYEYKKKYNVDFAWRVCDVVGVNEYSAKNIIRFTGLRGYKNRKVLKHLVSETMKHFNDTESVNTWYPHVFSSYIKKVYFQEWRGIKPESNDGLFSCTSRMFPAIDLEGGLWHCTQDFLVDKNDDELEGYAAKNYRQTSNKCMYEPNCKWNTGLCDGTTCEAGRAKYSAQNCRCRKDSLNLVVKYIKKWFEKNAINKESDYDVHIKRENGDTIVVSPKGNVEVIYRGKYAPYDRDPLGTPDTNTKFTSFGPFMNIHANDKAVDLYVRVKSDFNTLPSPYHYYRFDGNRVLEEKIIDNSFIRIPSLLKSIK